MNINRINKLLVSIPAVRLQSMDKVLEVSYMSSNIGLLKKVDPETGLSIQVALVNLAMCMATSMNAVNVAKSFIEFLRNDVFRRYVLVTQMRETSQAPKLQAACEKLHWPDDMVYAMTQASADLLTAIPTDEAEAPIQYDTIANAHFSMEVGQKVPLDLAARLGLVQDALAKFMPPVPEPEPEPVVEPEPAEPEVELHQTLDNGQKLVRVRTRAGNVHYIVVDADVDIHTAPEVWDLIDRDELHLSVNVTTDRLRRTTALNKYLAEGWSPADAAELMGVPKHIVTSDIALLRKLDRLGPTPGIRRRQHR